jgi:hypothetical protein
MTTKAEFSADRKFRYLLTRTWDERKPIMGLIMLNPSIADEEEDDNTITRCIQLAKQQDFGAIWVCNVYAFIATDPKSLKAAGYPEGPDNNLYLEHLISNVSILVCAWGNEGHKGDIENIAYLAKHYGVPTFAFAVNQYGQPRHPLYLPKWTGLNYYTIPQTKAI